MIGPEIARYTKDTIREMKTECTRLFNVSESKVELTTSGLKPMD